MLTQWTKTKNIGRSQWATRLHWKWSNENLQNMGNTAHIYTTPPAKHRINISTETLWKLESNMQLCAEFFQLPSNYRVLVVDCTHLTAISVSDTQSHFQQTWRSRCPWGNKGSYKDMTWTDSHFVHIIIFCGYFQNNSVYRPQSVFGRHSPQWKH